MKTGFWTNEPFLYYKQPAGQTAECKDSKVAKVVIISNY